MKSCNLFYLLHGKPTKYEETGKFNLKSIFSCVEPSAVCNNKIFIPVYKM